jgi:mono/diheme cytochrome c family protein
LRTLEHLGVFRIEFKEHVEQARLAWGKDSRSVGKPLEMLTRTTAALEAARPDPVADPAKSGPKPLFTTLLPRSPDSYRRLVDPADERAPLEARARSYLHANCAICHTNAGGGNAQIDLDFRKQRNEMKLINETALHRLPDVAPDKLVEPGQPERSLLYLRISRRGPGQMPPLASSQVDEAAARLIADWIKEMKKEEK